MRRAAKGPAGGAVLRDVRSRLRDGWPTGLTVLTGDDLFHLDEAQRALLEHLLPGGGPSSPALSVFGERKIHVGALVSAASSFGMFATIRVVLLRDVETLEGERGAISGYASDPPEGSYLLVRAPRLDARRALHKELLDAPHLLAFRRPGPEDLGSLRGEVEALAKDRGLKLERDVSAFLLSVSSGDLQRVVSELDKFACWRGRETGPPIALSEARDLVAGEGMLSGWEVADAVLARDLPRALEASRRLIAAGEEPRRTIGGLAWRARAMLEVKGRIEAGDPPDTAARAVWAGVTKEALLGGLGRYRIADLLRFPGSLLRSARTLNSRSIAPSSVLETAVEDLVAGNR